MNVAFIVTLDLDTVDPGTLTQVTQELEDACETVADVISVAPWQRPVTAPTIAKPITPFPTPGT